ncbi:hypothetical protein [Elongatibacter sediminis]|uniref:OmpR/PhoB-type domain-containing protein n=1 Tax=Elongatibacter sediminis TaxID=3119006 RepID=A0AAW9RAP9_9GAMM
MTPIETEVDRIIEAGALGRSGTYVRLLRYLAEATGQGRIPKEVDIATDVLGRDDFDPVSDSSARVYMHNLRQKLDAHYASKDAGDGPTLSIPKGKYQLVLKPREAAAGKSNGQRILVSRWWVPLLAAVAGAMLTIIATPSIRTGPADAGHAFTQAPAWSGILDDNRAITIVVGDYFIFSEAHDGWPGERLIRDFSINSREDFRAWLQQDPDRRDDYVDIRLSYLPTGTAAALNEVLAVLRPTERPIQVVPQSRFRPEQLRENHVIYIGYLSGMGKLGQFPFLASRLQIGGSYDVLIDTETGTYYESGAGPVTTADVSYDDYGYLATFPGPSGNQFLYVTGMRDEGLMKMASTLSDAAIVDTLGNGFRSGGAPAFEALFQVSGIDRTYVAAREQFAAPLDVSEIWMDGPDP